MRKLIQAAALVSLLVGACGPVAAPAPLPPVVPAPVVEPVAPPPPAPAPMVTAPTSALQTVLNEVEARHDARIGVVVEHLETGESAALNGRGQFRAASLYKLFVMHSAFARMRAGGLTESESLRFGETAFAKEPYAEWPVGTRTTASCALEAMVTISHNAASAMLIDRLGGEDRITDEAWQRGFEWTTITNERAYTSPSDVARLLAMIARGQAVDPAASAAMLALLSDQQRNDRLPLPLPADVAVAHKTGELAKLRHDAGIVFAPSGAYVLVAMVQDAPSDAAARAAAVDVSRAVYAHFEGSAPTFKGLPPRLAQDVLQMPSQQGRLAPLADPWAQTLPLGRAGVKVAEGARSAALRDVAVPDLLALQKAAAAAGAGFWVTAGHRAPTGAEAGKAVPSTVLGCEYQLPPKPAAAAKADAATPRPAADAAQKATPAPPPTASQHWLGTVVAISDSPTGEHATAAYAQSNTGRWLLDHAWEHGFVPAPPESAAGAQLGYEPWTLRWVGREMAAELRARTGGDATALAAELRAAGRELALVTEEGAAEA